MTTTTTIDAARVELLLSELRLPGIKLMWAKLAEQSDKEGWPAARFLAALAEHEMADRGRRRIERHLAEARLPAGKTLATFDFDSVPMVSQGAGDGACGRRRWLDKGANILLFGPPGGGKSHLVGSPRPRTGRERLARAVHAHHRSRAAAAGRAARAGARKPPSPSSTTTTC